jgi:EmrB/QacA subfamily drug resistance transporter
MNCGPMPCTQTKAPALAAGEPAALNGRWVLIATILGSSMDYIDGTVVNVALPSVQNSLGASGSQIQWVVEAYALFLASLLLTGGSLGDRFGLRKMFLSGVVVFAIASLGCGLAHGVGQLLFARCMQGVGGALLVPNSLALLSSEFEGAARGRAIGTWSGFSAIMTALGPVVGGWVVQHASWRWVFFLNIPVAIAALWITLMKVPDRERRSSSTQLDVIGALLVTAGLCCITYSMLEWSNGHTTTRIAGLVGVILLAMFLVNERHRKAPLIAPRLFSSRTFAGANLLTFFLYGALLASLFYLPLNLIQVQGYSPAQAGAAMLPLILLMFLLSRWAGGLVGRWGARLPLVVGPFIAAVGYLLLARPGVGGRYWLTYMPALIVLGLGMTISVAPLTTVVMTSVREDQSGTASGINNAVSQMASLLALALSSPLFFAKFSADLGRNLSSSHVSSRVVMQVEEQRRQLGAIKTADARAREAVNEAFVGGFRLIVLLAAGSAAAAGLTAIGTIRDRRPAIDS